MYLIVGLGNPGRKYTETRHNAGFMVLDYLAARHNLAFSESKWQAGFVKATLWQAPLFLLRPLTFMNLSGSAVAGCAGFYKIVPEKIIVVHDDLDLSAGRIKIVAGGGSGGHNGIRSIIDRIGSENFARLKIGIGRPVDPMPPDRYVLSAFSGEERQAFEEKMPFIEEGLRLLVAEGAGSAMNYING